MTDLITSTYAWNDDSLREIRESDEQAIRDLLVGHAVAKVADDHLQLDDGTLLRVVPNDGGCSCGAGDYDLTALNESENIITSVEFDYEPTGDDSYNYASTEPQPSGYYRIFVLAEDKRINLLSVEGDDGNGYYGTGFSILVRPHK